MALNSGNNKISKESYLGDEWSKLNDVNQVIQDYIIPYVNINDIIMEIGSGGGRISSKLINKCKKLFCLDISKEMLKICESKLNNIKNKNTKS